MRGHRGRADCQQGRRTGLARDDPDKHGGGPDDGDFLRRQEIHVAAFLQAHRPDRRIQPRSRSSQEVVEICVTHLDQAAGPMVKNWPWLQTPSVGDPSGLGTAMSASS